MSGKIEKWALFEKRFSTVVTGNPFIDMQVTVNFTKGHRRVSVDGFYDGDNTFAVRCMPDSEGVWSWHTHSSTPDLHNKSGSFECIEPGSTNHRSR